MSELYTPQYLDFIAPVNKELAEIELSEIELIEQEINKEFESEQSTSVFSRY